MVAASPTLIGQRDATGLPQSSSTARRKAAKIDDWPQNALRHGFASYHLAQFNNAGALALELGHTNSNLVFQHYRQLVKPKEAEPLLEYYASR